MAKLKGKISKAMVEKAAKNGISKELLRYRIAKEWDVTRAVTEPPRKQAPAERSDPDLLAVAKENGIDTSTYRTRVRDLGIDPYEAAVTKKMRKKEKARRSSEARGGIPRHLVQEAAANGISYITLYRRLRVYTPAWDERRAVTETPSQDNSPRMNQIHRAAESLGIDWRAIRSKQPHGHQKHDPVILAIAEANGIPYDTYIYRTVTRSPAMSPLDAATTPVNKSNSRKKKAHA